MKLNILEDHPGNGYRKWLTFLGLPAERQRKNQE